MKLFRLFNYKPILIFAASIIVSTSVLLTTVVISNYLTYQSESSSSLSSSSVHLDYSYDRNSSLIFVGGWPRSGTTLMRAMLDAHPLVRCGEETHIIPRFLAVLEAHSSTVRTALLEEAGITADILDSASASFLLEIIARHAEPAPRLCNKDPYTASFAERLVAIFPAAQFVLMLRDGRAVCHSAASLGIRIAASNSLNVTACLKTWSDGVDLMHSACSRLGAGRCRAVKYEQLILHPRSVLRELLEFLGVPWAEEVLHHHELINKPGGISVSRFKKNTP